MCHGKMTARMYSIWSLAYRTHSHIFVRHRYDLFCVLLSYNDPSSYFLSSLRCFFFYLSKCSVRPSDLNEAIKRVQ